jgi:hypothetical protein
MSGAASNNAPTLAVELAAGWKAAAAAVSVFMQAWYAASEVMLPHADPQALVRMLIAVANVTSTQTSPFGPGVLPDEVLQQQGIVFQRAGQEANGLINAASVAAANALQAVPSAQPKQQQQQKKRPNAAADSAPRQAASQQARQQQQQQQQGLLLPPLPPASWIGAAVQRLTITRSAYSEVALLRAFEALSVLLEEHPDRRQLLMQQQQQQQWWWRQKELELNPAQMRAAAAPQWPGTQPADAFLHHAASDDDDDSDYEDDASSDEGDSDGDNAHDAGSSSSSSSVSAAEARRWSASWLHPAPAAAAAADSSSSGDGSGDGSIISSSSSAGCVSVLSQLALLVKVLGNELGEMLPPDSMVDAAAAVAR